LMSGTTRLIVFMLMGIADAQSIEKWTAPSKPFSDYYLPTSLTVQKRSHRKLD